MNQLEAIRQGFPPEVQEEMDFLSAKFVVDSLYEPMGWEVTNLKNEKIIMPIRIYWDSKLFNQTSEYTVLQKEILSCIYSRHYNGFVRQKAINNVISSNHEWVIPYILRVASEYVIEIVSDIYDRFDEINKPNLIHFIQQNPAYWHRLCSRITSYWDCYYRRTYPRKIKGVKVAEEKQYVGFRLIHKINQLEN